MLAGSCELCGQTAKIQVHQIRRLADLDRLGQTQPDWAVLMAKKRRKTLMVCPPCHEGIHEGHETAVHEHHWRARCG
ncbi:HNH endonuclease [Streptomyces adelaidensis]|uniref:HNH endonuclease n=1 Tax=Streptomyces adelaidensis TaxID=2796465 RepID=UPI003559276B